MTIEEAIEVLTTYRKANYPSLSVQDYKAIELGIEALRREEWRRAYMLNWDNIFLPGETKEEEKKT